MKALINPDPKLCSSSPSCIFTKKINKQKRNESLVVHFRRKDEVGRTELKKRQLSLKATFDSATIDGLGIREPDIRNPTLSSSYRTSKFSKPNQTVLEAQTRVCTGPTQTKPLTEEQAFKVFDTILRSGIIPYPYLCLFHSFIRLYV